MDMIPLEEQILIGIHLLIIVGSLLGMGYMLGDKVKYVYIQPFIPVHKVNVVEQRMLLERVCCVYSIPEFETEHAKFERREKHIKQELLTKLGEGLSSYVTITKERRPDREYGLCGHIDYIAEVQVAVKA